MIVGSLFSGIGGFDPGFERAGMRTAWFVEREPYCQAVLRKHWPGVPVYDDVCDVGRDNLTPVDLLCGGFPCQDLSAAGKGAGLDGARSGLWAEFHRIVGELRPRYVVVENVPMLRSRGLGRILGEMAALGYDAEWDCIPAQAVGAPHRRDRVWIVAYPGTGAERSGLERHGPEPGQAEVAKLGDRRALADAKVERKRAGLREDESSPLRRGRFGDGGSADHPWAVEPDVGRVAYGVPDVVDRLRALGNALVPQIAELIGRRIVEYEDELKVAA